MRVVKFVEMASIAVGLLAASVALSGAEPVTIREAERRLE